LRKGPYMTFMNEKLEKQTNNIKQVSFFESQDHIYEEIYDLMLTPEYQFIAYTKRDKNIFCTDEIQLENGKKLLPNKTDLIENKVILLPSEALEFESEQKLLEEIKLFIHKYLDIPSFYENLSAHYILMSWVFDRLSGVPYLRALGDYGVGKTRFIQTVGSLCYKPMFLAGATSDAYLFRVIELFGGTLVINELERVNTDLQSQIVNILNNGYEKGMSVGRIEGERKREPRTFNVFCPKVISTRKKFNDQALESRIITIPMQTTKRKDIPPFISESFWDEAQNIRNKLLMYRFKHFDDLLWNNMFGGKNTEKLDLLEPRLRQTLLPIFYVISDTKIEDEFISYALDFQKQVFNDRSLEVTGLVFEKLYNLYQNNRGKVPVKDVAESVNTEIENEKYKLTSHKVGKIIREELGFKTQKGSGGLYFVIFSEEKINYLVSRYGIESPQSPSSPSSDTASREDSSDLVD